MYIFWITLTEAKPEYERKVLRKIKMEFPKILEELYQAMEKHGYEISFIKNTSIVLLKYSSKESKDIFGINVIGNEKEISAIFADEKIKKLMRHA